MSALQLLLFKLPCRKGKDCVAKFVLTQTNTLCPYKWGGCCDAYKWGGYVVSTDHLNVLLGTAFLPTGRDANNDVSIEVWEVLGWTWASFSAASMTLSANVCNGRLGTDWILWWGTTWRVVYFEVGVTLGQNVCRNNSQTLKWWFGSREWSNYPLRWKAKEFHSLKVVSLLCLSDSHRWVKEGQRLVTLTEWALLCLRLTCPAAKAHKCLQSGGPASQIWT